MSAKQKILGIQSSILADPNSQIVGKPYLIGLWKGCPRSANIPISDLSEVIHYERLAADTWNGGLNGRLGSTPGSNCWRSTLTSPMMVAQIRRRALLSPHSPMLLR